VEHIQVKHSFDINLTLLILFLQMSKTTEECAYEVIPLTKTFGAEIKGIELKLLTEDCAKKLREEAYMYRFLLFKQQELPWQEQIKVTIKTVLYLSKYFMVHFNAHTEILRFQLVSNFKSLRACGSQFSVSLVTI
jgi:hypothetical protein